MPISFKVGVLGEAQKGRVLPFPPEAGDMVAPSSVTSLTVPRNRRRLIGRDGTERSHRRSLRPARLQTAAATHAPLCSYHLQCSLRVLVSQIGSVGL